MYTELQNILNKTAGLHQNNDFYCKDFILLGHFSLSKWRCMQDFMCPNQNKSVRHIKVVQNTLLFPMSSFNLFVFMDSVALTPKSVLC